MTAYEADALIGDYQRARARWVMAEAAYIQAKAVGMQEANGPNAEHRKAQAELYAIDAWRAKEDALTAFKVAELRVDFALRDRTAA